MSHHKVICGKLEIAALVMSIFGIGVGLYLSSMVYLVWGLAMFVMFLAGLHDLNKKTTK